MADNLQLMLPASLDDVRIRGIPSSAFYISAFISEEEEMALVHKVTVSCPLIRMLLC